jgi:hypothetical protein
MNEWTNLTTSEVDNAKMKQQEIDLESYCALHRNRKIFQNLPIIDNCGVHLSRSLEMNNHCEVVEKYLSSFQADSN